MATVHFVYNTGPRLKTPERITYEIGDRLARAYPLAIYGQHEAGEITPKPGDILLGHPGRYGANLFDRAFHKPGWSKRIVFCPFSHGMPRDAAAIDPLVEEAEQVLALCGPYWFDTVDQSLLSHWRFKMMRCDLGVNRTHYPVVKTRFNPPGRRRFLYIGNAGPMKGVDFLCRLIAACPDLDIGWIGDAGAHMRPSGTLRREFHPLERRLQLLATRTHGGRDWRDAAHVKLASDYDFLLTCGRSDSNPTTILETAAWGLIPIAPLQCGYYGDDWLVNIPLDDVAGARAVLLRLNDCPESELVARQQAGFAELDERYTWDNAAQQVIDCIEAPLPHRPTDAAWLLRKRDNKRRLRAILARYTRLQRLEDRLTRRRLPERAVELMTGLAGLVS